FLVDSWGGRNLLFVGILAAALGLAWLGLAQHAVTCLLAALFLALATACVAVPSIVMLPHTFQVSWPHLRGPGVAAMNLGFIGFTLGHLLAPNLARGLFARLGLRNSFLLMALTCLVPATLVTLPAPEAFPKPHQPMPLDKLAEDVHWWMLLGLGLCYFPLEH